MEGEDDGFNNFIIIIITATGDNANMDGLVEFHAEGNSLTCSRDYRFGK